MRRPRLARLFLGGDWVLMLVGVPAQAGSGLPRGLVVSFVTVGSLVGNRLIEICALMIVFQRYSYSSSLGPFRICFYFSSRLLRSDMRCIA